MYSGIHVFAFRIIGINPSNNVFARSLVYSQSGKSVNFGDTKYYDIDQKKYLFDSCNHPLEKAYFQLGNDDFFNR